MYSIIHSIYISSHIIPHHYICYDKTGNKCNAGLTGRPVLYTEPINWPRVNFRNKKKKKKVFHRKVHVIKDGCKNIYLSIRSNFSTFIDFSQIVHL